MCNVNYLTMNKLKNIHRIFKIVNRSFEFNVDMLKELNINTTQILNKIKSIDLSLHSELK